MITASNNLSDLIMIRTTWLRKIEVESLKMSKHTKNLDLMALARRTITCKFEFEKSIYLRETSQGLCSKVM